MSASLDNSFFLKCSTKTLVTDGCFKRVTTPAHHGADLEGDFQSAIKEALNDAKQSGLVDPIVVGAIPFDSSKTSALFVPQSWKFLEDTSETIFKSASSTSVGQFPSVSSSHETCHDKYTTIVSEAVNEIRKGSIDKVVLGRVHNIETTVPYKSVDLLAQLMASNPSGFTFQVPLPDGSRLAGASPELLIQKLGTQFSSQPLAGSAPRDPSRDPLKEKAIADALLTSEKDLHEHKIVVDSMKQVLVPKSSVLNIDEHPICISTSKLWHLATPIRGHVKSSKENVLSLACALHPTPALSGFPHQPACELIKKLEPFDREYFGGIVGYCDSDGNGEWYIAIRCGKFTENKVQLFAAAGIVADSNPESEWRETGVKLSTMLHALRI